MGDINIITIFLTGLVTGGLTCMAVQGGLLAATIAQRTEDHLKTGLQKGGNALPILVFLITKLVAYTLLGALLGWLGSFFALSLQTSAFLQIAVGIFMIGTAFAILDVHPLFRYFIIQPPRFLTRLIRKESKSKDIFAPAMLGALTVFIPCGTTQAMIALSVASSNPVTGAIILFAFTLGTSPVFFLLGYFAAKLGGRFEHTFMHVAAYAIILLALFTINSAIPLTGSDFSVQKVVKNVWCVFSFCDMSTVLSATPAVEEATITINSSGYTPHNFSVRTGSLVTLHLVNRGAGNCAQSFTIPKLGIQKIVPLNTSDTITFTAPTKPGQLAFMCSMGMYEGTINVI